MSENKTPENKTPENKTPEFKPKKGEEGIYHVKLTKKIKFAGQDIETEKKIQKFKPKAFAQFEKNAKKLGFDVEVLHAPKK